MARRPFTGALARLGLGVLIGVLIGVAVVGLLAGPASAHVTLSPASLPAGAGDAILTFRVPNESPTASVVGLRVEFPTDHLIAVLSPEAGSGWVVSVKRVQLATPVRTDDGTFASVVSEIDWSQGSIPVGQFGAFAVLAQGLPSGVRQLAFKAVQLYSDGSSVAWIEVPDRAIPDPPHPAPVLQLTSNRGAAGAPVTTVTPAAPVATTGTSSGLAVVAIILAGLAVVVAALAVWLGRPLGTGLGRRRPKRP